MDYVLSPLWPIPAPSRVLLSHRAGWALYWAESLGAKLVTSKDEEAFLDVLKPTDWVYLYHGMEFEAFINGRPLNVPPGTEESWAVRIKRLARLAKHKRLVSLDYAMPYYGQLLKKRAAYPSAEAIRTAWSDIDIDGLDYDFRNVVSVTRPQASSELIFGDSHALALMRPGAAIYRHDGATLYGQLRRKLDVSLHYAVHEGGYRNVTLYLGNVDIRHHLARPDAMDVKNLTLILERQLVEFRKKHRKVNFTIVLPLPIETEDRRIPKTGYYKGKPFYGTWRERRSLEIELATRLQFTARVVGAEVYNHPSSFRLPGGELNQDVMEKPSSVHIRPAFYRYALEGHAWTSF